MRSAPPPPAVECHAPDRRVRNISIQILLYTSAPVCAGGRIRGVLLRLNWHYRHCQVYYSTLASFDPPAGILKPSQLTQEHPALRNHHAVCVWRSPLIQNTIKCLPADHADLYQQSAPNPSPAILLAAHSIRCTTRHVYLRSRSRSPI